MLTAKFSGHQSPVTERQYRGSITRLNWASASSEITSILNEALANAVIDMGKDIEDICRSEKTAKQIKVE